MFQEKSLLPVLDLVYETIFPYMQWTLQNLYLVVEEEVLFEHINKTMSTGKVTPHH